MSARASVSTQAISSPPPGVVVNSGQAFIVGQTTRGPIATPTQVFGLADFEATFGARSGGTAMYDVVASAFKEGLGSAWILRAAGPTPVAATVSLDSAKIVVTAKEYGAFANTTWTALYTTATKTITLVKDAVTVSYTGTDAASLQAAAAVDPDVTVTVSSLPTGNVGPTALASGTDDYGNVAIATQLAYFDADLGDGAVVWPGKYSSDTAAALQTHCAETNRLGITTVAAGTSQANALYAAACVLDGENLVLVWPHVTVLTNAGDLTVEPTGPALGWRARAHVEGTQASPIRDIYGKARWITGVEDDTTATEWALLNAGNVSVIRTSNSTLRLYGWRCIDAPDGVTNLQGAQFRDTINRVAVGAEQIAETFVGRTVDGKGLMLGEFAGQLTGMLDGMSGAFFAGDDDPGFKVDVGPGVNTTASLAAGDVAAAIGVRLAPTAEFITISITATDAAGAI